MNTPFPSDLTELELQWLVLQGKSAARRNTDAERPDWHENFVRGVLIALRCLPPREMTT